MSTISASDLTKSVELSIEGMTCGGCATTVRRIVSRIPGVTGVHVDLSGSRATVEGAVRPEELVRAVRESGYGAELANSEKVSADLGEGK